MPKVELQLQPPNPCVSSAVHAYFSCLEPVSTCPRCIVLWGSMLYHVIVPSCLAKTVKFDFHTSSRRSRLSVAAWRVNSTCKALPRGQRVFVHTLCLSVSNISSLSSTSSLLIFFIQLSSKNTIKNDPSPHSTDNMAPTAPTTGARRSARVAAKATPTVTRRITKPNDDRAPRKHQPKPTTYQQNVS